MILLANHIHRIANLLHMDAMQQLEVALLDSPASGLIHLLVEGVAAITIPNETKCTTAPGINIVTLSTSSPDDSNCRSDCSNAREGIR